MSEFAETGDSEQDGGVENVLVGGPGEEDVPMKSIGGKQGVGSDGLMSVAGGRNLPETMINGNAPLHMLYCGICSMPPEFCEYGSCYEQCRVWIQANCPEILTGGITAALGKVSLAEGGAEGATASSESEVRSRPVSPHCIAIALLFHFNSPTP